MKSLKKWKDAVAKDLWVVVLDVIAVNLSYYLALLIRFYVNWTLRPVAVDRYLPAWIAFTPWYTVLCLCVFGAFRLYGGIWRYAGINDMNRIILASVSTALLHVLGTALFFTRMPWTYYLIGALLQFGFIVAIRFSYRVLLVEKRKLRRSERISTVVVGSGENGRRVVKNLEESELYRPVAIYSSSTSSSTTMDGIPIVGELKLEGVGAVFIADPLMPAQDREKIKAKTEAAGAEFHDFSGYYSNLGGHLSLTELLSVLRGPVTVELDGKEKTYDNGESALKAITERYSVVEVNGEKVKIKLEKQKPMSTQAALDAAYQIYSPEESRVESSGERR